MSSKKGQSEFLAYVLLIGMAVGLAAIVGVWMFNNSEKTTNNFVRQSEIEEKCGGISIGVFAIRNNCPTTEPNSVSITNTGNFIIQQIKIINSETNQNCLRQNSDSLINLKPGFSTTKTLNNCRTATILPLVEISEKEIVGCSDKKLVLSLVC